MMKVPAIGPDPARAGSTLGGVEMSRTADASDACSRAEASVTVSRFDGHDRHASSNQSYGAPRAALQRSPCSAQRVCRGVRLAGSRLASRFVGLYFLRPAHPAAAGDVRRSAAAGARGRQRPRAARLGRSRAGRRAARVARHQNPCRDVDERAQHQYTQDAKQSRDEGVDVVAAGEPGAYSRQEAALAWTREALLREPRPRASERVVVDIHLRLCGNGHSFFPFLPATARVICVRRACLPHAAPALRVAGGSPAANRRVFPKGHPGAEKGGSVGVIPTGHAEPPLAGPRNRSCAPMRPGSIPETALPVDQALHGAPALAAGAEAETGGQTRGTGRLRPGVPSMNAASGALAG
jgi:hypothetical protein